MTSARQACLGYHQKFFENSPDISALDLNSRRKN